MCEDIAKPNELMLCDWCLSAANGEEDPNVYDMDSSIFPTSVGANPMQANYSIAKIFTERLLNDFEDS